MIVDWKEYHDKHHVFGVFLCDVLAGNTAMFDSSKLDVKLTIDGVEYDIVHVMDVLDRRIDMLIERYYESDIR